MIEEGKVVEIKGKEIIIELERRLPCGYCHACDFQEKSNFLKAYSDQLEPQKGQRVSIRVSEGNMILVAFLIYIVPLLIFILSYVLGENLAMSLNVSKTNQIFWALLSGGGAMLVYFILLRLYDRQYKNMSFGKPRIEKILA